MDKVNFNKKFGLYLKKVRTDKGLSQSEFASLVGVNAQNISAIERGEVSPTLFWLTKMCEGLNIDTKEFMNEFYG